MRRTDQTAAQGATTMTWRMMSKNERGLVASSSSFCLSMDDVIPQRTWLRTWMPGTWAVLHALLVVGTHSRCGAGSPARLAAHGHSLVSQLWDYIAVLLTERKFVVEVVGRSSTSPTSTCEKWKRKITFGASPLCGITCGVKLCEQEISCSEPKLWDVKCREIAASVNLIITLLKPIPNKIKRKRAGRRMKQNQIVGTWAENLPFIQFEIPFQGIHDHRIILDDKDPDVVTLFTSVVSHKTVVLCFMLINLRRSYCSGSLFVISTTRGALPGVDIQYLFIDFFELMIMRRKGDNSKRVFLAKAPWLIGKTFELEEGSRTATEIIDGHYKWFQLNENQFYLVKMGTGWDPACEIWDCQEQTHLVKSFVLKGYNTSIKLAGGFIFTKEAATLHVIEVTTGHSILLLDSVGSLIFDFNVDLLP